MTEKALEANELLCDNHTVETHNVIWSDFLKKNLAFQKKVFGKKTIIFISNKVYKDLKMNKAR